MSWFWRNVLRHAPPWENDCVEHDRAYWEGGTKAKRRRADLKLAAKIVLKGYPLIAMVTYYAIRVGGHPWWPFSWRWDYGRHWPGEYK